MDLSDWVTIAKELGPALGVLFFFIWRDCKREDRLSKQIEEQDEFIHEKLVDLIEKTNQALNRDR